MLKRILVGLTLCATPALAYDCNTSCDDVASFRYPCPTWNDLGRKCTGREPQTWAVCQLAKEASCRIWEQAVAKAGPVLRPRLENQFNRNSWESAERNGTTNDYTTSCVAAGVAACGAAGGELGGPWGAAIAGGIGTFVSFRICSQSQSW